MEQAEFYKRLGNQIRHVRSDLREISQAEFADRVGLSRPSIVNIEKGRQHVSTHQLMLFALALGISPIELLPDHGAGSEQTSLSKKENAVVPKHLRGWYAKAKSGQA